ncbi:hypothetical protein B0A67_24010 [Flavobacterium aquidurense]|jgi:hypothetical protein|uniref:hypothetical protein n=1 Tax=Flavobacterium aquidurense TaxID=362413 RepID=UPI0009162441|nr:hypothetical protein [Flavobacterium aquidurense]OXA65950.1 hypothetical protein B0A67_24010 [Flavobacterium aquidurense]SHH85177.1 hypothetical protein SAMN05444481_13422 [Flavobacterium frigidimaris]
MKKKNIIYYLSIAMIFLPMITYAQQGGGDLVSKINTWKATLLLVSRAVIGLAAIGGGLHTYFKVQADDGGSGKKAIGNFILALVFAALLQGIIEFFLAE